MNFVLRTISLFVLIFGGAIASHAQSVDRITPIQVLVKPVSPFVIEAKDGSVSGFSIDLWEALGANLGVTSEITVLPNLTMLLENIDTEKGDVAIAAVTITEAREGYLDFSHPYFRSGLQIMVPDDEMGWLGKAVSVIIGMFSSQSFRIALLALVALVLGTAHIIWLVERRANPDFTRSYPLGLWDGIYWTMVTISTVGYGDKTPKSHLGRAVSLVLMIFGYIAFAWFTATIASTMTVAKLEGEIRGPEDLNGKLVATVSGSTSENYLLHVAGVQINTFDTIEGAYAELSAGQVDAIVYDYPVLSYYTQGAGKGAVRLVGPVFQRELYGIVFAEGSIWREKVNQALLHLAENGDIARLHQKWFASAPN